MIESMIRAIVCALIYGVMENRLFSESTAKPVFLGHFKAYHLAMFALFTAISFDVSPIVWLWNSFAMPLIQDSSWQMIRRRKLQQKDWSNIGGFRLIGGIYVWYIIVTAILIVLTIIMLLGWR
jgi:hypothetical protein